MDLYLKGKTAIITAGGGENIGGETIPLTLAAEGVEVVMADIAPEKAEKVVGKIKAASGKAAAIKTDVTNYAEVEAMVKKTLELFGKIDILVNVAGGDIFMPFVDTTPEIRDRLVNLNYKGMMNCCRLVLPHMIEKRSGAIVSIASDAARIGEFREGVYSGCKAAQIALSKTIARENGRHGIRINIICPGMVPRQPSETPAQPSERRGPAPMTAEQLEKIAHDFYPLRRLGTPQDIANAVAFLVSDRASWITGQTLSVSGGYSMAG